ncbi:alcohol dehydrogenase [Frondihabitans sucicola]|uniref:Alcohol dehydrogenase n=1 Tax=Frondihabitans sucicola TaxID=1268041 RepID=A0ABN6XVE0_9MICO|nr:zinc-binding dehydrogenase [Frondihabitans sucicola]BDZ48911.1 alcohol dehydrogenase [Frondihabitans sucicola]
MPTPEAGPGQVRIAVRAAGVCLSDVHLIEGMLKPQYLPGDVVTLGHEVAGVVDQLGAGVTGVELGQRVLLQAGEEQHGAVLTRGVDYDGGWAEFAVASAATVVPIPDGLPFEQACFIPDAVSTPWSAITATGRVQPGKAAGVWGIGGLGAHGVQLLRLIGAAPIVAVDPLEAARERALEFGADVALDPAAPDFGRRMKEITRGTGLQTAFDFAGVPAVREQAAASLGLGGRLVLVGLTDQPVSVKNGTLFSYLRQQILGHYGSVPGDVVDLVALQELGRLDFARSVSRVMPLTEAAEAVRMLSEKDGNPIRIVLRP